MNHRKIRSQGYIPFSWEEKPGIPKFINRHKSKSSSEATTVGFGFDNPKTTPEKNEGSSDARAQLLRIAPPPGLPRRSCSGKDRDDPFVTALKSCTKGEAKKEKKNLSKSGLFSCKESCSVRNDNLVKFSKLPPIPKERYYSKSFVRNFN